MKKGSKEFYQWLKCEWQGGSTVFLGDDQNIVTDLPTVHKLFENTWKKIFNKHLHNKPDFEFFFKKYEKFIPKREGAPKGPPTAKQLHSQAKGSDSSSVGGMDGIAPRELKILPISAWEKREKVLMIAYRLRRSPRSYYHVSMPALKKIKKMQPEEAQPKYCHPKDFRLISLFSALYRIESGAAYRAHVQWLLEWINANMHGCIPGHESGEVSFDAQADIEEALLDNEVLVIALMDYFKYFDSMEPTFVAKLMEAVGIDPDYANMTTDLYKHMNRYIKIGQSLGKPFTGANGLGQGDSSRSWQR